MTEKEYIDTRLDEQQKWYSGKSRSAQEKYKNYKKIEFGISCVITIFAVFSSDLITLPCGITIKWGLIISILSSCMTYLHYVSNLEKYHELWINYRSTSEALKREKVLYLTQSSDYKDNNNRFSLFVERCENIMCNEKINWSIITGKKLEERDE